MSTFIKVDRRVFSAGTTLLRKVLCRIMACTWKSRKGCAFPKTLSTWETLRKQSRDAMGGGYMHTVEPAEQEQRDNLIRKEPAQVFLHGPSDQGLYIAKRPCAQPSSACNVNAVMCLQLAVHTCHKGMSHHYYNLPLLHCQR